MKVTNGSFPFRNPGGSYLFGPLFPSVLDQISDNADIQSDTHLKVLEALSLWEKIYLAFGREELTIPIGWFALLTIILSP